MWPVRVLATLDFYCLILPICFKALAKLQLGFRKKISYISKLSFFCLLSIGFLSFIQSTSFLKILYAFTFLNIYWKVKIHFNIYITCSRICCFRMYLANVFLYTCYFFNVLLNESVWKILREKHKLLCNINYTIYCIMLSNF